MRDWLIVGGQQPYINIAEWRQICILFWSRPTWCNIRFSALI